MIRQIPSLYLFTLFAGTIFFIPSIFVERFITAPGLWMQTGISVGIAGYALWKRKLLLPHKGVIIIMLLWVFYHIWQNRDNIAGLFFMKEDSANGRLLIWKCATELIARKLVCGYGGNGFTANNMK